MNYWRQLQCNQLCSVLVKCKWACRNAILNNCWKTCGIQAINNFCKELGITRSDADIHLHKLEHHVRADLEACSPRMLAVLRPLLVTLVNLPEDHFSVVKAKVHFSMAHALLCLTIFYYRYPQKTISWKDNKAIPFVAEVFEARQLAYWHLIDTRAGSSNTSLKIWVMLASA